MNAINKSLDTTLWHEVCQMDDLIDDVGVCVLVDDVQIALFRVSGNDEIYAINNFDPFSNANVLSRGICGDLKGQVVIASPIYKQHFNLKTGQCLEDETVILPTYSVRIVDASVQLANN